MALASAADTIVAAASPPGDGQRTVLRISGGLASSVGASFGAGALGVRRDVRRVRLDEELFDTQALAIWMPGPGSYTAEDTLELHLPGAPPLVAAAIQRALELGCRIALPGEFTRRAFENGRIDLARAEGVADLIAAETTAERRAALALLGGGLERRIDQLRDSLEELCALCEASLDFDEADTGHVPRAELRTLGEAAAVALEAAKAFVAARAPVRELPEVVLLGRPNAGKSSLFNLLGGRALISHHAGTTRDALVLELRLPSGREVRVIDLPGLERARGPLEREAAERAEERIREADLALLCVDSSAEGPTTAEGEALMARLPGLDDGPGLEKGAGLDKAGVLWVWTKSELVQRARATAPQELSLPPESVVRISVQAERGLQRLLDLVDASLDRVVAKRAANRARGQLGARHSDALQRSGVGLAQALELLEQGQAPLDIAAEHLRDALQPLEEVTGRTQPEDLLTRIFSRFCLGK